jgi:hypothetical protein
MRDSTADDSPGQEWRDAAAETERLAEFARAIDSSRGEYKVYLGADRATERGLRPSTPSWFVTVERGRSRRVVYSSESPRDIEAFLRGR